MDRVIKFRAWDGQKMIHPRDDWYVLFNGQVMHDNNKDYESQWHVVTIENFLDEPCNIHLMQFTGIKDSQGVEIYEGDIVEFTYWWFDGNEAESTLTGQIVYQKKTMSFALRGIKNKEWLRHIGADEGDSDEAPFAHFMFDDADFSVIGNIHENPALLESIQSRSNL